MVVLRDVERRPFALLAITTKMSAESHRHREARHTFAFTAGPAARVPLLVKAAVCDLGKTKSAKQKAAKEARKIVEMKGKQMKDALSLAMIQIVHQTARRRFSRSRYN